MIMIADMHNAWVRFHDLQCCVIIDVAVCCVYLLCPTGGAGAWRAVVLLPRDSSAVVVMMTGGQPEAEAHGCKLNRVPSRVLRPPPPRAPSSSGRRLRRVSGKRHHVDLDRTLGIGGAVTNLLHVLPRPKLNNSYQRGRGVQLDSLAQG